MKIHLFFIVICCVCWLQTSESRSIDPSERDSSRGSSHCSHAVRLVKGVCHNGKQSVTKSFHQRAESGRCEAKQSVSVHKCVPSNADECGKRFTRLGKCTNLGLLSVRKHYYIFREGKCRLRFTLSHQPCEWRPKHSKGCPVPRIIEPSPCNEKGYSDDLVLHYERNVKTGRCELQKSHVPHVCRKDVSTKCPEPQYHQRKCHGGYRSVFKFYWVRQTSGKALKCRKKIGLKQEQCAKLVVAHCPTASLLEKGICRSNGFRVDLKVTFRRSSDNRCHRTNSSDLVECQFKGGNHLCPKTTIKTARCDMENKIAMQTTTYYSRNTGGKCRLHFKMKPVACGQSKQGSHVCPPPRIVEPGQCNSVTRKMTVLITHYEYDAGLQKCVHSTSYERHDCPAAVHRTKLEKKLDCPEPAYMQGPCVNGYRHVKKTYYVASKYGKCRIKIKLTDEQCARLVVKSCPSDVMREKGICRRGMREDIKFVYRRNKDGSCVRRQEKTLVVCKHR